jgi:uncharacterized membrane protein
MVGIQVASSLVMWLSGYRGRNSAHETSGRLMKRSLVSLGILAALAGLLTVNLRRLIANESYEAAVRAALQLEAATHQGAYLADVRFRREVGRTVVTAVYRTPVPFAPEQVALIERGLPRADGDLELRIRSIPITVASRQGYLYANDDQEYAWVR